VPLHRVQSRARLPQCICDIRIDTRYVKARTPKRPELLGRIRLTPLFTCSIQAWTAGMANVRPPQLLDSSGDWQVRFNAAVVAVQRANGFSSAYSTHSSRSSSRSSQLACGTVLRLLV
jgi:hypothetical protein